MKSYKIIPHTADIRLKLLGTSFPELFLAGLEGISNIAKKDFCDKKEKIFPIEHAISITAKDLISLLIDFLSEVLTYSHVDRAVFCKAFFHGFKKTYLKAVIQGIKVNYFDKDIKAVTYHEAEVKKNKNGMYETTIVFDI